MFYVAWSFLKTELRRKKKFRIAEKVDQMVKTGLKVQMKMVQKSNWDYRWNSN